MTEATNPLFDDEKEFLERQKEEYKNALLENVADIKDQSQKIGKTLLIAGGVLAGAWLLSKLFGGGSRQEEEEEVEFDLLHPQAYKPYHPDPAPKHPHYNSLVHEQEDELTLTSEHPHYHHRTSGFGTMARSFMNSELVTMMTHQLAALLMVYITKKVEEYLNIPKNHDIAGHNAADTKDIDFAYHEEPDAS